MILYKYDHFFLKSQDPIFDELHEPGSLAPHSGLYRCVGCGAEAVSTHLHPLPPQNHHQHSSDQGQIR
jgi:hypothetical protein